MERTSAYTPEIAEAVCRRLSAGESLRSICRDDAFPPESTVRGWAHDNREGFAAQYAHARELQAHAIADELLEIADDARNDWMERQQGDDTVTVLNSEHVQRSRLRLDTRKWLLSKMLPKVYGDKLQHANAAGDGDQVTKVEYSWAKDEATHDVPPDPAP